MSKIARFLALVSIVGSVIGSTGCEVFWNDYDGHNHHDKDRHDRDHRDRDNHDRWDWGRDHHDRDRDHDRD